MSIQIALPDSVTTWLIPPTVILTILCISCAPARGPVPQQKAGKAVQVSIPASAPRSASPAPSPQQTQSTALSHQIEQLVDERRIALNSIEDQRVELEKQKEDLAAYEAETQNLDRQMVEQQNYLAERNSQQVLSSRQEQIEWGFALKDLAEQIKTYKAQLDSMAERRAQLAAQNIDSDERTAVEAQYQTASQNYATAQSQYQDGVVQSQLQQAMQTSTVPASQEIELRSLQQDFVDAKTDHKDQLDRLTQRYKESQTTLDNQLKQVKEMESKLQTLQSQLNLLRPATR